MEVFKPFVRRATVPITWLFLPGSPERVVTEALIPRLVRSRLFVGQDPGHRPRHSTARSRHSEAEPIPCRGRVIHPPPFVRRTKRSLPAVHRWQRRRTWRGSLRRTGDEGGSTIGTTLEHSATYTEPTFGMDVGDVCVPFFSHRSRHFSGMYF